MTKSLSRIETPTESYVIDYPQAIEAATSQMAIFWPAEELGVEENITSPTFAIVNEYTSNKGLTIFHFDCYRLKNIREAYDIGAEEYFYSGKLCFIEWPEKVEALLPEDTVFVNIEETANGDRLVTMQ